MTTPTTHGGTLPVPLSALLDPDPDLRMVWAPMSAYVGCDPVGCRYEACCCDEHCFCQCGVNCECEAGECVAA